MEDVQQRRESHIVTTILSIPGRPDRQANVNRSSKKGE